MKARVVKMLAQHTDFLLYSQKYRVNQGKAWFRDKKLPLSAYITSFTLEFCHV